VDQRFLTLKRGDSIRRLRSVLAKRCTGREDLSPRAYVLLASFISAISFNACSWHSTAMCKFIYQTDRCAARCCSTSVSLIYKLRRRGHTRYSTETLNKYMCDLQTSHVFTSRAADRLKILIAINRTIATCTRKW